MTVGVDQLRPRLKRSEAIEFLLAQLTGLGFNANNWKLTSNQHKFVRAFSTVVSDLSETVRQITDFGINAYATGTPLTELSRSHFGNTRHPATKTTGPYKLTNAGSVPYTLEPGQLILESTTGVQFANTQGGSLSSGGGTLTVEITAIFAGASGNVANGSITKLVTSLAGVTGTNEAGVGGAAWYSSAGNDEESVTAIRQRNDDRLATLNQISMPGDGYRLIAMLVPGVERVKVDDTNPRGPNTIDVYAAKATGPAGVSDIAAIQALFNAKRSPSANTLALAPTELALNPAGTVHFAAGFMTDQRKAEVKQRATDYVNTLPIGGVILPPATSGAMPKSELVTAMSQIPGVVGVKFPTMLDEVSLTALQLLTIGSTSGILFQQA